MAANQEPQELANTSGIWVRGFFWTRDRLRRREDSEHEITANRLMFSGVIVLFLYTMARMGNVSAAEVFNATYMAFAVYFVVSLMLFFHVVWQPQISVARRLVGMFCDFTMVSYIAAAGGLVTGFFFPLFLWTVFGNGFRFGIPYLYAAMIFANAGFVIVLFVTDSWSRHTGLSIALCASLVLLPLYAGKLIRKLSEAKRQAEEANRAKGAFLAGVSHELRTPLNAIIGLGGLLHGKVGDRESGEMISTIVNSGRSLLRLINGILDFSRIEAGRMPVAVVQVNLHESLRRLAAMLAVQAKSQKLTFAVHITGRTPGQVLADYSHLEQILINLVANAIKFTEKGFVVMRVDGIQHHGDRVRLRFEVSDTGIGIRPDAQARIFERFVQADASIIDRYGGTGLGLAISKQLVSLLGGTMGLHSLVGEGSTFWFEVDVTRVPGEEQPTIERETAVLVSRDEELKAALERAGVDIIPSSRSNEIIPAVDARRKTSDGEPILIVDAREASGEPKAFLNRLCEEVGPSISLIVVTDECGVSQLPIAMQCKFVSSINWPADPDDIRTAIHLAKAAYKNVSSKDEQVDRLEALGPRGPALSVLVADDNRTNQMVIAKILECAGHVATLVDDGQAALDALLRNHFDVVLMDVNMPGMNGIEATKLYRFGSLGRTRVPIIALTADATPYARKKCTDAGMDGYATKPIEPIQLLKVIDEVLSCRDVKHDLGQTVAFAPPTVPDNIEGPINLDILAELERLGGQEFVAGLVTQFSNDATDLLSALRAAVMEEDVQRFRDAVHALRGSAANLGASLVFETCRALRAITPRQLAVEGDAHVTRLLRETDESVSMLKAHIAGAGELRAPIRRKTG